MHQIAFEIFHLTIRWYGVMMAIGFLSAVGVMHWNRGIAKIDANQVASITFYAMVSGVLGARLFYVIQFWSHFSNNLLEIVRIDHGGLVFYGGFICAVITIALYCKVHGISILRIFDICTPSLAIGHALGRVGCFLNGCCFGKPCSLPWAVKFPQGSPPYQRYLGEGLHPVQLYETAGNLIIFGIVMLCLRRLKAGQTAAVYLFLYGVLRFCDEFFRGDHKDFLLGFTPAQIIGLLLVPAGIVMFIFMSRREDTSEDGNQGTENG